MKHWFLILLCASSVSAHAKPKPDDVAAYRALIGEDQRLANVSHRLARANALYCANTDLSLGWMLHNRGQYPDMDTARAAFGFAVPTQISALEKDGPADRVGLRIDDGLISVETENGQVKFTKPDNPSHRYDYKQMELLLIALDDLLANNPNRDVTITYLRGAKEASVRAQPVAECASKFQVDTKNGVDAGADGNRVRVTIGLLRYAADDAELAAVVAHEFAHNILGHRARLSAKKRGKGDTVLATEIEADRLSVWLMTNAGYNPQAALRFAERYGRQYGLGIFSDGSHQRWKRRVAVMQAEIDLMSRTPKTNGKLSPPLLVSK